MSDKNIYTINGGDQVSTKIAKLEGHVGDAAYPVNNVAKPIVAKNNYFRQPVELVAA